MEAGTAAGAGGGEGGPVGGRCACGSLSTCDEYRRVFGVDMCKHCKARDELLHKGKAKQLYLLTDSDIAHLGSLRRDNPLKSQWSSMRLYLQSQVEAVAVAKYGSLGDLEARRRSQSLIQSEKRMRSTRDETEQRESKQKRVKALQRKLEVESEVGVDEGAVDRPVDGQNSGAITRTYANGMKVELEEI